MRWSESVTLAFVKIYLKHECLWNPENPFYKLRFQREKAFNAIASEFRAATSKSLTVPEIKMKIKNLRTTYQQAVNKILTKSSPDHIHEPSLVWFHEMDRCLKNVSSTRHSSFINKQQSHEIDSSNQVWTDGETQNETIEDQNPDPLIFQSNEYSLDNSIEFTIKKEHKTSLKNIKNKKYRHKSPVCYVRNSNSECREDEFDIYGKFIATQLRKMDTHKALRLQLEIQSLVSEARLSEIT